MAQRTHLSSFGFIVAVFAVAIAVVFGVSFEFPDIARSLAFLLVWLSFIAVVFRALEMLFDNTIGKRKAN